MKKLLLGLGLHVRDQILRYAEQSLGRQVYGNSPGGDAQFDIDKIAEQAVVGYLKTHAQEPLAIYTEDGAFLELSPNPRKVLVIDPIDGTRPTSAGLEMGMISIASAPIGKTKPRIADVEAALLMEIKSGYWIYADEQSSLSANGFNYSIPRLSQNIDLRKMFWSIEFNGHPMKLMSSAYAHLVDQSANTGGIFVFNSASFSISRIITGQLDAYVDIGNRIFRDHPNTEKDFRASGRGYILHLFPYDIAAAVYLAQKSGVIISDGYGNSLGTTELLNMDPMNQQSCIAACNSTLHQKLLSSINW